MNTLHYRLATQRDTTLLAHLNELLIREGADTGPADRPFLEERMRQWLSSGHDRAVLFQDEGERVVAYALYNESPREIFLRQFMVLEWARRQGIGREAMELLRDHIWRPGKRLTLEVLKNNTAGHRFWRALGYRDCAVTLEIPAPERSTATKARRGKAQPGSRVRAPRPLRAVRRWARVLALASLAITPFAVAASPLLWEVFIDKSVLPVERPASRAEANPSAAIDSRAIPADQRDHHPPQPQAR